MALAQPIDPAHKRSAARALIRMRRDPEQEHRERLKELKSTPGLQRLWVDQPVATLAPVRVERVDTLGPGGHSTLQGAEPKGQGGQVCGGLLRWNLGQSGT